MEKVIIIGGGFAGLAAGTALAERGYRVHLFEGRQVLGGRAYSFIDPKTRESVDNGQHLFMGCYLQTQALLKRVGMQDALHFQNNLSVDFAGAKGLSARLRCWPLPAPLHLLSGLFRLSTLSWLDRFRLFYMHQALKEAASNPDALQGLTVRQWLTRWKQSEQAQRNLWDLISVAALNEDPAIAAAGPFATVLSQAFFEGRKSAQLGFAAVGLSELYATAARTYIESRGGEVSMKSPVERLLIRNKTVEGVQLREGKRVTADWVISAVPPPALLKMLSEPDAADPVFERLKGMRTSPIISLHLWFDKEISRRPFIGLLGTHVQWLFNKSAIFTSPKSKGYVSLVISGARVFADWPDQRLLAMALEELKRVLPAVRSAILLRSLVIKEHQATLSPEVGCEALRPEYRSPYRQLLLAGDWTKTGLPATIESACLSGHACADIISSSQPSSPLVGEERGGGSPPSQPSPTRGEGVSEEVAHA